MTIQERNELLKQVQANMFQIIKDEPAIVVAMAKGYIAKFWFDLGHENEKELALRCAVESKDGEEMTFGEFIKDHQEEIGYPVS